MRLAAQLELPIAGDLVVLFGMVMLLAVLAAVSWVGVLSEALGQERQSGDAS